MLLPAAITSLAACQRAPRLAKPEQIVLISVDALRADYLGPWRDGWGHTPNLDRFADDSVVFTDTLTSWPDTSGSHKSLLYGVYQHAHRTSYRDYPEAEQVVAPVAALQHAGLSTAAYFSIGNIARAIGLHHGFEEFDAKGRAKKAETELPELQRLASTWLSRHASTPFFLFLHTYQVHAPYQPPEELLRQAMERHGPFASLPEGFPPPRTPRGSIAWWRRDLTADKVRLLRAVYEGEVAAVDQWFGELIEELKRLGIYERAAIIVTADHGEALGEQGHVGHSRLGEEQVRVPLIVRIPGVSPRTVADPVSLVDIMPTVFDLLELAPPYDFEGLSLLDTMRGLRDLPSDRLRPVEHDRRIALYQAPWKLTFDPLREERERLFRLGPEGPVPVPPEEQRSEIADMLRRYAAMIRRAEPVTAMFQSDPDQPTRYTEETLRQLRHLGYLE